MYNIHLYVAFETMVLEFTALRGFSDGDTENKFTDFL